MREGLAALALASVLVALGDGLERWLVAAALPMLLLGRPRGAAVLLAAALTALAGHLLLDHHSYRLVWLYGGAEAPWHLRLGGLWAGDEATLLVLAAGCALAAPALRRHGAAAGGGAVVGAILFAAGTLMWDPFRQTAEAVRPAANPHLQTIWMTVHPPMILAGYVLLLAPVGALLDAAAGRPGAWLAIAGRCVRGAWLLLSLGLLTGMAWAYEDFTFAPFWHWDPVQSAVFAVWALTTAQLHLLRRYQESGGGAFGCLHPLLGLAAAVTALLAMVVTRHPSLTSSHRYVGETSLPLLVVAAVALALVSAIAWRRGRRLRAARPDGRAPLLTAAVVGLVLCAVIVAGHLAAATLAQAIGAAKPAAAKPYYEMLARWAPAEEVAALAVAFARWEPDPVAIDAALLTPAVALALLCGHRFLPVRRRFRWGVSVAVAGTAVASAWLGGPLQAGYQGTGMTATGTVDMLPWLDALLVALAYAGVAALAGAAAGAWRLRARPAALARGGLVALAHAGTAIGLAALLVATVFDSYTQTVLRWPDDIGRPVALADGYSVTVRPDGPERMGVAWSLDEAGREIVRGAGPAHLVEARTGGSDRGPVRLMCEILDYRYARYAAESSRIIAPGLSRGLWRDVQVWVAGGSDSGARQVPLVLKVYPMVTWIWIGFGAAALAGVGLNALDWRTPVRPDTGDLA
ncbi:MAG TPA: cytochrome c biogenesis protein CcsA [Azospirillum sp.]|nr:cytochrome c biogenesis protein CcsA [Azospirillum sp.]